MPAPAPPVEIASIPSVAPIQEPGESAIRDYAFHLYQQGGSVPGHEQDDWFEARACLQANIPKNCSHRRLHHHLNGTGEWDLPAAHA